MRPYLDGMRFPLALAALMIATPAMAADYHALTGRVVKVYCQMGECFWEQIDSATSVGANAIGELFKVEGKSWEGSMERKSPSGLTPTHLQTYAFCSRVRPSMIFSSQGKWMKSEIAPGSPDTIFHSNSSSVIEYWLICHGIEAHDLEAVGRSIGRKLGYQNNKSADDLKQSDLSSPEDILSE